MNKEKIKSSLLIVPANDAEALQILDIAEKIGLATHASYQLHGGRLDAEPDIRKIIERSNKPAIAVVELPGPETEAFIRSLGKEFVCIDHHGYDGLDRSRDEQGNFQPSSLEQFLNYFEISDADLSALGFDPRLVRSIGIMDQGYVWELSKNGYSPDEVRTAVAYKQKFHERLSPKEEIERVMAVARRAWERRSEWNGFVVVDSSDSPENIRGYISFIAAEEFGRPQALILLDRGGKNITVQESDWAQKLFDRFGGYTFGTGRNWGYLNEEGKDKVGVEGVEKFLSHHVGAHSRAPIASGN